MTKHEILTEAITSRESEVLQYQINIDNYLIGIELAKQDPDLTLFVKQLQDLLTSSIYEQKKAKIILEASKTNLASL